MKICLLGLDNLPVLAPEFQAHAIGGESVQQTLLARALVRRGHDVSMVTADDSQAESAVREGIRIYRAYRPGAGIPVLRFVHPRWSGMWTALRRADAELYYTSCAGMHVGLLALYCARHGRRFVFRCASDADCDPSRLLIRYARDRWLYRYGLRRADVILVQNTVQARTLEQHFGLAGRAAGMLVEWAGAPRERDIDVLWVGNIRRVKRPDLVLEVAARLPDITFHMVGGSVPDETALYERLRAAAVRQPNLTFHGPLPYAQASAMYGRARLLINTSELEGFPNAYLQAWMRGAPIVSFNDPDGIIARYGLGAPVASASEMSAAIGHLLGNPGELAAIATRCRAYVAQEYPEDRVLAPYLSAFEELTRDGAAVHGTVRGARLRVVNGGRHG